MEKRALLAIALTFIVLFLYQYFFIKPEPRQVQEKERVEKKEEPAPVKPVELPVPKRISPEEKEIRVETELYSAVFTTRGGTLKYYEIKKYKDKEGKNVVLLKEPGMKPPLGIGSKDDLELSDVNFAVIGRDIRLDKYYKRSDSLIFEYADSGVSVRRTYAFYNDSYRVEIKDEVSGIPDYWITIGTDFGIHNKKDTWTHIGPVLLKESDRIEFNAKKLTEARSYKEGLKWIAQEDKYFFASLVSLTSMEEARVWKQKDSPVIAFRSKPGINSFILYAGPKEYERLKALKVGLEHIVDFGFFSVIALPLFWILKVFYKFLGNYGWAIVLLTLIIRIPFIPLVNKSQKAMKKMHELQPRMAEVKEKYKKDPQRMQREMMELYKKHKVNPLGGCLPILLQIPVFFALYKILLIAIELRGAPFMLWIKDLSAPDTLLGHIPEWFPLIGGFAVGPLPILMGITMVIQQKMTPTSMDPTQNKIMMLMPIIFTFLFLNFASGLVLYWLMNNVFSIAQQLYANKKLAKKAS
ncbi:MAG: membrane protein insertase YidC [Thermodesulfovibrionales bacterium]|nr:membrane protein insertase YidC [Thermodesulfovibrionales bacterium]